jgi:alkylation response protein AidB-like acyl-CoA dehydrogenase
MLSRMKAKLDAGRSMLYQTARYVDLYKCLEDIQRDRKLTPEERTEMKQYSKLADAFTPIAKGMNSEYASQNAYDAISIHGGSGFIMEYKSQRLYRDARIFSIYEGTTQLQVVAAIRYITNGTYLQVMRDMLQREVSAEMRLLQERVAKLVDLYEQSVKYVNDANNQEMHDFLGRRLYDMTAEIIMALLLIEDASRAEGDLKARFTDSANVYTRMVEENVCAKAYYVMHFTEGDLQSFRTK